MRVNKRVRKNGISLAQDRKQIFLEADLDGSVLKKKQKQKQKKKTYVLLGIKKSLKVFSIPLGCCSLYACLSPIRQNCLITPKKCTGKGIPVAYLGILGAGLFTNRQIHMSGAHNE